MRNFWVLTLEYIYFFRFLTFEENVDPSIIPPDDAFVRVIVGGGIALSKVIEAPI